MSIKEFADKYIKAETEAWEKGNFKALEALEDPNVVYHNMSQGRERVGWEAHKEHIVRVRQNLSNLRMEFKYLTGEGSLFAASWNQRFIRIRENPDRPETIGKVGKEGTLDGLMMFRLENGKIIEVWDKSSPTVYED